MRTLLHLAVPLACVLAACGPSDSEEAEAERAKAARTAAAVGGLAEPPVDLGEGLILTVLQRGSGAFVSAGGRVRVHYDASVVAVSEEPLDEPVEEAVEEAPAADDAQAPTEGSAPVDDAAITSEAATDPAVEAASEAEPVVEAPQEPATEAAPAADPTAAPDAPAVAQAAAEGATADPAAPAPSPEDTVAPAAEPAEPALPRRFDSSRARGVPDTWDLSRTASPRLIEGLRRGLVGLTAGSRLTLRVPAALAWGDEGLRDANVPPRADVLYEIELLEVLP